MSKFLEESKKRTAAKLDDIDAEIEKLKKQKQSLREDNLEERLKHFKRLHHHDAKDVLDKYDERLRSCIYQGGVGYEIWYYHGRSSSDYKFYPCHAVVRPELYEKATPVQMEQDAHEAVHGEPMKVTEKPHREVWGN